MTEGRVEIETKHGPFTLKQYWSPGGFLNASLVIEGTYHVWTWPVGSRPRGRQDFAEELAKALALVDGRFEVRRIGE